jgi:hypothetical protein
MRYRKIKKIFLLLGLMIPIILCDANEAFLSDEHSHIQIKEAHVQGVPKGSTIQASINGHTFTADFSVNIGQVVLEITTSVGASVESLSVLTPNSLQINISNTGNYVVTFTLSNGDVYYGEFTVTN